MALVAGTYLGAYEILGALGAGGMGEVYRARDTRLGREVAIKVLPAEVASDPERLARFEREARAVASLNHPNIVVLHSIEEADGVRFLTMERIEGRSLAEAIPAGGMAVEPLLEIAVSLAEALAAAHARGVVHRDVKPANVMLTHGGHVKVLDFGLAKRAPEAGGDLTQATTLTQGGTEPGSLTGTVPYMSPEQIRGEPLDARTDLFSLGIVLYELATGRRPFRGPSAADVTSSILRDTPAPMTAARRDLPAGLDRIVGGCLEKSLADRTPSARQVADELRALRRALDRGVAPRSEPASAGVSRTGPPTGGRRRMAVAAVAAIVLVTAAWLGFRTWRGSGGAAASGDRRAVGVLDFENLTGDPAFDWMKRGTAELLATALVQSPQLDVFDAQRLADLAAADRNPSKAPAPNLSFLARHRIPRAITGTILRSGRDLRIHGRIVDTRDGRLVHTHAVEGVADSGLFHLVGRLIPDLQVALEVNLTGNREAEGWLREITTNSADAYRLYLRGHQALLASHWREAATAYEKALELDSTFVAARTELSGAYWNLGDEEKLEVTRAAMRRLRSRADHRSQLRIDLLESVVGWDAPGLVRAASELVQLYPENRFYTYLLGRGYFTAGEYRRCLETLRPLVEQRYEWAWTYVLSARSAERLGDPATARRTFELGMEITRDPELGYAYVRFLRGRGEHAKARAVVDESLRSAALGESPVAEGELRLELGRDLLMRRDSTGARTELRRASSLLPRDDEARPEVDSLLGLFGK